MPESLEQTQTHFPRYADASLIRTRFADTIEEIIEAIGEITLIAKRDGLVELMTYLRDEPSLRFNYLSDIGGVDLGEFASPRFVAAYQLYSLEHNHRLRVTALAQPGFFGNWRERIFDLMGGSVCKRNFNQSL